MAETEPKKAEGLEGLDAAQVEELQEVVSETDKPQADSATGEPEVDAEGCETAHKRKVAKQNEKDKIDQDKSSSAIFTCHVWEFPYVSKTYCAPCRNQDESKS